MADLHQFLLSHDYAPEKIAFIEAAKQVNVTPRKKQDEALKNFFSAETWQQVIERDRLLFELFPEARQPFPHE